MKRLLYLLLAGVLVAVLLLSCSRLRQQREPAASGDDPVGEVQQIEQETPSGATDEQIEEIQQLADRCRAACNEVDIEGILDCLTPAAAKPLRTLLELAGTVSETGEDQVMGMLCSALGAESSDYRQFCRSLETELSDIEVDGDKASAGLTYHYEQDGQRYVGKADVTCKRIDGQWYISSLKGQ